MAEFDPSIIHRYAERLHRKAASVVLGSVIAGALFGALIGAVPLTSLGSSWPIPSNLGLALPLMGALAGGLIGYVIGSSRALGIRYQAQLALHQLQLERNTAAATQLLAGIAARPVVVHVPGLAPTPVPAGPAPVAAAPQPALERPPLS
ncbi:MAG TPA: hypothetical protein VGF23_10390 [Gaiellaceae bacterium]|jgi:hypothetical protein